MFKGILKTLLPQVLLNTLYQKYNILRIHTIDKLFFPEHHFVKEEFNCKRDAYPFQGTSFGSSHLPGRLQEQIKTWQKWTQDEYLLVYESPCLIEPHAGWALTTDNKLIYFSLGFSRASYLRKPDLQALRMHDKPVEEYAELISLRDTGEENYYHFYNDVLSKLFFLEEKIKIDSHVPILIAASLYKREYFQYFLQHPYLHGRTWIVQDQQYVRSYKTYFCKPLTHTARYYSRLRALVQPNDLIFNGLNRKIFITRSSRRLRYIENETEIVHICREMDFEVLDFDDMAMPEQLYTLANARYVAGVHGAGLVNMLFRGKRPLSLLEIFPPGEYYPFHYMLMASQLGYDYDGLIGSPSWRWFSAGFYMAPERLKKRLQAMLASGQEVQSN